MAQRFVNNFRSHLLNAVTDYETTLTLTTGTGSAFPALSGNDYCLVTVSNAQQDTFEIVKVTAISGDVLTVVRGYDGTVATGWVAGSIVDVRMTAGTAKRFEALQQFMAGGFVPGWNYKAVVGTGTAEQPEHYLFYEGVNALLATPTYNSGRVESMTVKHSDTYDSNQGVTAQAWVTDKTMNINYDSGENVTEVTWV